MLPNALQPFRQRPQKGLPPWERPDSNADKDRGEPEMSLPTKHPMDWKRKTLSNTLSVLKDGTHFSPKAFGGRNLYITSKNIRMGKLDLEDVSYIPDEEHQRIYSTSPVKYGDVLLTKDGAKTGNVCINTLHEEFSLLSSVAYLRGKTDLLLNEFLVQWLSSPRVQYDIKNDMAGQAITRLTLQKIGKLKILLPPLPEQKAIADLLSTWDEAIEKTERQIQAKEKRFQWLLRKLISEPQNTQKNKAWKKVRLGEICSPVTRKNSENNTNVLTSSAEAGLINQLEFYKKSVSADNVTGYYLLKNGEFAYNRSAAKGYPYGATKRLDRYDKGALSTLYLCFALKPNAPCESDFLLHLFESGAANRELRAVCQEGARSHGLLNITKSDFFGITLYLPNQDQQKKIQAILNTAQKEIDLLKLLADKYKTQKRGLMQKLLTGEWRIKPEIISQYS
ncbi:MAG: restriction endonuclease subunit S [Lentisphaeria bacterium]